MKLLDQFDELMVNPEQSRRVDKEVLLCYVGISSSEEKGAA